MNERLAELMRSKGLHKHITPECQSRMEMLAQAVVEHIVKKIDAEVDLAYEQDEAWTASTLQALSLDILDEFDMELDLEDDKDEI